MWYIVKVDCFMRAWIDTTGKANKYGQPKLFKTRKAAQQWIERRTYSGMSFSYEIKKMEVR